MNETSWAAIIGDDDQAVFPNELNAIGMNKYLRSY